MNRLALYLNTSFSDSNRLTLLQPYQNTSSLLNADHMLRLFSQTTVRVNFCIVYLLGKHEKMLDDQENRKYTK